jgi:hypothetical protein
MSIETITAFRGGSFTAEPAPDWLISACHHADKDSRSWDEALTRAIGQQPSITKVEDDTSFSAEVIDWVTPDGGRYVELWDSFRAVAEVWIPDPADWLAFHTAHVLPFLRTHAETTVAYHLDRIANCLIAYGRHGEGRHIDLLSGCSQIDINRQRERVERLGKVSE